MKEKLPLLLLISVLLVSAFLRLYRIGDYLTFLGDEGRDVLIAKEILEGNFTLLGPRASAGDFFLGPVYYYMIAPFLWLFRFDPVGPAIMVALLSVVTTWLTYYVGKRWFSEKAGLAAAALYAVSPVVVTYSHSSWNPNVLPFFALLLIYLLFLAIEQQKGWKYFVGVGVLLGIALQLHYLALFLAAIVFFYTFFASWLRENKIKIGLVIKRYLQIFLGFIIGFSPFLLFEVRHGFPNLKTIFGFIFTDTLQQPGYETGSTFTATVSDVFFRIFAKLVFYFPSGNRYNLFSEEQLQFFSVFVWIMAIASLISIWFVKNKRVVLMIYLWFFLGVLLFGFYKKSIYDYYFTFLFPLPFLIVGNALSQLSALGKHKARHLIALVVSIALFTGIFAYNLSGNPFQYFPNRQKLMVQTVAEKVIEIADNKPYNFALISGGNSDHAYRYFLEVLGHPPVMMENVINDPERKTVTDQLIIVCEGLPCEPLGHSLFEVAGFGRAEIAGEWTVLVVKVYKLVPYKEKK